MEEKKNQIHLIAQYYHCSSAERQAEIDTCLRNNLLNPYLTAIHLLTEEQFDLSQFPNNEKIIQKVIGERLTFEQAFCYANEADSEGQRVWILSNADIFFDESINHIVDSDLSNTIFALSRSDVQSDGSILAISVDHAHGSQDAWVFKSPIPVDNIRADFYLGIPGSDNKILYEFLSFGYLAANPCEVIRAIHLDLARLKSIDEKTSEYALLRTPDNVIAGRCAPGPYQYFLYPSSNSNAHHESSYTNYLKAIKLLTKFDELIVMQNQQIASQNQQIASQNQQIASQNQQIALLNMQIVELNYKVKQATQAFSDVLNSATWKITAPVRRAIDSYLKFIAGKDAIISRLRRKLSRRGVFCQNWLDLANSSEKPIAIIPCAFEYDELVNQRPINFAKELAAIGYLVLYVPWQWGENHKIGDAYKEVSPNILQIPMIELIRNANNLSFSPTSLNLCFITIPSQEYVRTLRAFREAGCILIYDIMDDWEEFYYVGQAKWYRRDCEEIMVLSSDIVSVVSIPLRDKFCNLRNDISVIGNGLTPSSLGEKYARVSLDSALPNNKIIVGYFGHMTDSWLDWDSVIEVCSENNDIEVQLVGYGLSLQTEKRIGKCSNITYLGKLKPSELHTVVKNWHVGLIPFKAGKLSTAVDPIKIYEYLYFGLPSVVAGVSSIMHYPAVYYSNDTDDLAGLIRRAYRDKISGRINTEMINEFLAQSTWENRIKKIINISKDKSMVRSLYA